MKPTQELLKRGAISVARSFIPGNRCAVDKTAEIQKSDRQVCETQEAIFGFTNPFTISDKDNLCCISSGTRVPKDHENDILSAELRGKQAKETFIQERLEKGENFFEPIKRMNLEKMEAMGKNVEVKTANNKIVEYRQQGNVAMQLLVRSQTPELKIDLADLMKYPLTPVPFSIGTANGCFAKLTSLRV